MARIRTIKPEFWQDEKLARLSLGARLLFIGLWNIADDVGRLRGNPLFVRAQVFPYEPTAEVETWLHQLDEVGVIQRYEYGGESFVYVVNFLKHQQISRPSPSRLPSPEDSGSTHGALHEPSMETPSGKERKGREGIRERKGVVPAPPGPDKPPADAHLILEHWAKARGKPAVFDRSDYSVVNAALKLFAADQLRSAVDGVALDPWPERRTHDSPKHVFGSASQVRKFIDLANNGPPGPVKRPDVNAFDQTDYKPQCQRDVRCGLGGGHGGECQDAKFQPLTREPQYEPDEAAS